ncbi:hypothetical protein ZWY2020_014942, partial [Hordeum vulgare]
ILATSCNRLKSCLASVDHDMLELQQDLSYKEHPCYRRDGTCGAPCRMKINYSDSRRDQRGARRSSAGWARTVRQRGGGGFHNPHKKYERKLKAHIETRTPYMLYKVCSSNTMPFQWSSFCPKSKCKHYFHNHLKPAKLAWTTMYWKKHKN